MFLLSILVIILVFFVYKLAHQWNKPSDVVLPIPFVRTGYLPILGHILPFLRDKLKFILECRRHYGTRFYIELVSQRMIFLLDSSDWTPVIRNPHLALPVKDFGSKTFGITRTFLDDEATMNEIHRFFIIYLQNAEALIHLTARFAKCVRESMIKDRAKIGPQTWHQCSLLELSHRMIFEASGRTLFGEMNPLLLEKPFITFDKYFHYFGAFLPDFIYKTFFRNAWNARHEMSSYFTAHPHSPDESDFIYHRAKGILAAKSRQANDLGTSHTSIFWASVGNTIPATCWALYYILRNPDALQKIQEEIRTHLPPFSFTDPNDTSFELWTRDNVAKCVYLESAINEMLRIQGNSMVTKRCYRDTEVILADGTVLPVRENDIVALFPAISQHDDKYFSDPETYQFDRFIGKNIDNTKGFLTFGAGKSICPGRHFAKNEIKICTALILYNMDYEFLDTNLNVSCQKHRVGFGIAAPERDILIRYRYKE